ncbi:hypothetical protein AQ765_06955 [Burkholderia pseudomallei]|uniref:Uncharacterized protein n=1 Tax=Burkholderia pseudomallei (strain 1106a) TaxID=357348 RepID=A3P557_BURP0|nr:hypothetical protein BURPS1106A_A1433 [Burkholderia pseudomallei 1106a]APD37763.1 hypothetical protein BK015_21355 [Burkholderia pseudomallei]EES23600.1 hypothetical protein BURPS1106B_0557 [Burkholderia pseudomallei 1106b]ARK44652.1 hypothetical protein BOC60_31635 [Burkholderia pseudomallei]ARK47039.1 hypothetical protein BOC35_12685 [Burkholderia pseudomallei]
MRATPDNARDARAAHRAASTACPPARGSAASAAPPSLHGPARLLRRSPLPRDCLSRRVS